ncbi:hypothetical protein C4K03_5850 [Pseudomonas synxantha]|uniref:Uncharacterized protein n=1 Tax=Pseudomonas synxantha TaxID=47883 RepID=A0A3G7UEX1_9PSED|nr:hypothetical protein C4K03_5850 [Pseudomonas synxantha]
MKTLAQRPYRFFIGAARTIVKQLLAIYWRQRNAKKPCCP